MCLCALGYQEEPTKEKSFTPVKADGQPREKSFIQVCLELCESVSYLANDAIISNYLAYFGWS